MNSASTPGWPAPELPYPSLIGQVLKQARIAKNIHQSQVAAQLGLTQSAYSRLESGDSTMNTWQLRQVARCIGTPTSALLKEVETLERQLEASGVTVVPEKKTNPAAAVIGIALLLALFGG